jgi:hypothetical protein
MEELPDPPSQFSVDATLKLCSVGTRFLRVYFRAGKHPASWNGFRHHGPTTSRFDHHTEPSRAQQRGILYATTGDDAFVTAMAELFQYTRLIDLKRGEPWLVVFDLAQPIHLLDTTGHWPVRAGGNMAINSGPRSQARKWSRAIYDGYPDAEGVWYSSSLTNGSCAALYERARRALPPRPAFNEALQSAKLLPGVLECAARLNYDVA